MNISLQTLARPATPLQTSRVLAENGFTCSLLTLEPGAETPLPAGASPDDQLLFVLDGEIAVESGGLTTVVNRGAATVVAATTTPLLAARTGAPARVLRVEIPPRQIIRPEIITPRT